MRTALASRSIWEWVDELRDWSWPSDGGSAGFEAPDDTRRKLFTKPDKSKSTAYMGSLPVEEVALYETRIEEIYGEMEGLAVEEIKTHVMTTHIMPLSRPTTPVLGPNRPQYTGYNRMEDLTAVVTAIVVQTLPNLARLSRLLQIWSIRVGVLQQVPSLLRAIEDAEVALRSGWSAITVSTKTVDGHDALQNPEPALSRNDFGLMKAVIEKKVATPGRTLDYMLDRLEGMSDTLPDDWLDRLEAVERNYGEWVAACERKIGELEWRRTSKPHDPTRSPTPVEQAPVPNGSEKQVQKRTSIDPSDNPATLLAPILTEGFGEPSKESRDARQVSKSSSEDLANRDAPSTPPSSSPTEEMPKLEITLDDAPLRLDGAYEDEAIPRIQVPSTIKEEPSPSPERTEGQPWTAEDEFDVSEDFSPSDEVHEPELPPLPTERRGSNASQESTLLHGASSHFGLSSDGPEISASPDLPRTKIREAEYVSQSPEDSPPSSPPLPQLDTGDSSVAPENLANVSVNQDDLAVPKTPLEPDQSFSEYFDDSFSVSELASPSVRRDSAATDQLQQQLSEIIDNIPAKIKLRREPPNLNPPDLQLPNRVPKKPAAEPYKRSLSSVSNVSTRTATPSFTLAPAKNSRPRHQRSQQEIKVYHLSRSTGEAPIKLFIRCVGENGERVMVRVGGGWADLSEYLKEYASHHGRRSAGTEKAKVEVRDAPRGLRSSEPRSSPPSRPASALEASPLTPLTVRKTRRSMGAMGSEVPRLKPRPTTPAIPSSQNQAENAADSPDDRFTRSRSSSRVSWVEEDSSFLGLAGPSSKKKEMSEENKAWVESVKEKVRIASGERKVSAPQDDYNKNKFGELGKVGGTKRLFRKADVLAQAQAQAQAQAPAQAQSQGQGQNQSQVLKDTKKE